MIFLTRPRARAELREWRSNKSNEGGKKKSGDRKFDNAKAIASAVDKKVKERMKSIEQEKSTKNEDTDAYIMSLVDKRIAESGKIVQPDLWCDFNTYARRYHAYIKKHY